MQASLSFTTSQSLLKLMSIESVMPSNPLTLCRPCLLLPPIFPSIRVFSNELALCIRWPKYWSFCFSISPSNECLGFISFRIDWFDLLAVQGTLKESCPTPQFESISSLALSFLYSPTLTSIYENWKNHIFNYMDLCWQSNVCFFNMLSAAAAAKSLQSCLTLCDPIDGSPPGSHVPGILQARTLEWVAISFSNA